MDNYRYCEEWVFSHVPKTSRVLDYGCGSGLIVGRLREKGVDAFGVDAFYEGGDYSPQVQEGLFGTAILRLPPDYTIPFPNEHFDIVFHNQVFEHVENMDYTLSEIARVLKPGGTMLSLFPDKSVWREGHCGIPFLHWFPKGSRLRVWYATLWRLLGFGYHKNNKTPYMWAKNFCEWLDNWTHYRSQEEIETSYEKYFCNLHHIEDDWLRARLENKAWVTRLLPPFINQWVVRKLAGLVFACQKR